MLSLSEQVAFSFRAGYFLFSSRLYSLSNIPNPSRKDSRTSKSPQPSYKQAHNLPTSKSPQPSTNKAHNHPTSKAHNLPTSKSPQPSTNKAHNLPTSKVHSHPTSKVHSHPTSKSPQPHHIPNAQKYSENEQILQNIPNILPFNIFLKSVLKKNRLSRLFDLEISIFYCNFATNLLTH